MSERLLNHTKNPEHQAAVKRVEHHFVDHHTSQLDDPAEIRKRMEEERKVENFLEVKNPNDWVEVFRLAQNYEDIEEEVFSLT